MTDSRYDIQFHTFGCKVNTYDTGLLQSRLARAGHQISKSAGRLNQAGTLIQNLPRVHVLNTCAVTAEATKDATRLARRIKSREPMATVVVTGCGAQVDGAIFDSLAAADLVIANSHKSQLESILDGYFKGNVGSRVFRSNIFRKDDLEAGGGEEQSHTRSFLKIQDGCNSFCTYCVIPFARGKSRSIPVSDLIKKIAELVARGTREIVLTGVHIGDYEDQGSDGNSYQLTELVREILKHTQVERLRLSSLEPVELTPDLLDLFGDDRLCPHFHMSIQSANSRVLAAMRRNYNAMDVENALLEIQKRVPNAFVGMDVIAGFPGETQDEFADTYQRLVRLPWTRLHVFPYSERPGTKAATYSDAVTREEKSRRAQRLRDLSLERYQQHAKSQIGKIKQTLILKKHLEAAAQSSADFSDNQVKEFSEEKIEQAREKVTEVQSLSRDYWPVHIRDLNGEASSTEEFHRIFKYAGSEVAVQIIGFDSQLRGEGVLIGQISEQINDQMLGGI